MRTPLYQDTSLVPKGVRIIEVPLYMIQEMLAMLLSTNCGQNFQDDHGRIDVRVEGMSAADLVLLLILFVLVVTL